MLNITELPETLLTTFMLTNAKGATLLGHLPTGLTDGGPTSLYIYHYCNWTVIETSGEIQNAEPCGLEGYHAPEVALAAFIAAYNTYDE